MGRILLFSLISLSFLYKKIYSRGGSVSYPGGGGGGLKLSKKRISNYAYFSFIGLEPLPRLWDPPRVVSAGSRPGSGSRGGRRLPSRQGELLQETSPEACGQVHAKEDSSSY